MKYTAVNGCKVVRAFTCPSRMQKAPRPAIPAPSSTFFHGVISPDESRKASCPLLVKEWTLNTGTRPLGGEPRTSVEVY